MSGECSVAWCEERDGHEGLHRRYVATVTTERGAAVAVTVESAADNGRNRRPVIAVGNGATVEVVLDWTRAEQLAHAVLDAARRYG